LIDGHPAFCVRARGAAPEQSFPFPSLVCVWHGQLLIASAERDMGSKSLWWSLTGLFKSPDPPPVRRALTPQHPYHAVSIISGPHACEASRRFKGFRFLSQQAPRLPLPTCTSAQCDCRFRHHNDRRAGPRRRSDQGMMSGLFDGSERRRTGGRRAEDQWR
jgi:hypothetical protein